MIMDNHYFGLKYEIAQIEKESLKTGKYDKEALEKLKPELLKWEYYQLYCLALLQTNIRNEEQYQAIFDEVKSLPENHITKAFYLYLEASYLYTFKNDITTALEKLTEAENLVNKIKLEDRRILYDIIQYKAVIYADMKEYQNTMARKMFKMASKIKLDEVDYFHTYHVETMQCLLDLETGNYINCIKKLLALKKQCHKEGFFMREARILLYLGEAYRLCDKEQLALKCLENSLEIIQKHNLLHDLGDVLHCIGGVNYSMAISCNDENKKEQFLGKAIKYYMDAVVNYSKYYPRAARIAVALFDLGRALYIMEDYHQCIHGLTRIFSLETNKMKNKNERLMKSIYTYLALAHLKLKNTKEALKYIKKAENEYRETKIGGYTLIVDDREDQLMICDFYIEYYSSIKNYKKALTFARQKEAIIIKKKNEVIKNLIKIGNMK